MATAGVTMDACRNEIGQERASGQSAFQARPLRRIDGAASVPRSMIAPWHRRVSKAPSALTVSMGLSV